VPLVSGVCRTASAPTLSHGGSRLNASKPEASPKTRCPIIKPKNKSVIGVKKTKLYSKCGSSMTFIRKFQTVFYFESPLKALRALLVLLAQSITKFTRISHTNFLKVGGLQGFTDFSPQKTTKNRSSALRCFCIFLFFSPQKGEKKKKELSTRGIPYSKCVSAGRSI